jgi:thiol-disulfide isomerase/thioredoxin
MRKRSWLLAIVVALLFAIAIPLAGLHFLRLRILRSFSVPRFGNETVLNSKVRSDYDFQHSSLDGRVHRISQLKGKVVFANFWGTWCIRCVAEMPTIQELYNKFKNDDSVVFIIASRLDSPRRVRFYAKRGHYDMPFYTVRDEDIPEAMQFSQYPTTFIYAKDGSIAEHQIGGADWNDPKVFRFIHEQEKK